MRICLFTPGFCADDEDWCIPALSHLVGTLAERHELTVISLRYPHRDDRYRARGATVRSLGGAGHKGLRRLGMLLRAQAAFRREHHAAPFDLVHGLWADESGFVAAAVGRRHGLPTVVSLMGGELVGFGDIDYGLQLGFTGRSLVGRSLRRATVVTVGSSAVAELARAAGVSGRLETAHLGIDTDLFQSDGKRGTLDGEPALLQVASLVPVKEQQTLLAAFSQLAAQLPDARLHLVGDGPLQRRLASEARRLQIADRVTLHGAIDHDQLPAIYRAADLHLVSSRFESQGMAVLEAAACGTGTVGTAVGLLPELVPAARTVPVGDAEALANATLELLADPKGSAELGAAALDAVRDRYTLDHCVTRLEEIYRSLAE
jgi:glycosyltransferase involved in cell wall biosynthesis